MDKALKKSPAKTQTNSHILQNAFEDDGFNQGSLLPYKSRHQTDPNLAFLNSPASCSHWRVGGVPRSNQPSKHQSAAGMITEATLPVTQQPQATPQN